MRSLFVIFILLNSASAYSVSWEVYRSNNSGAKKLAENSFHGAYQDFNKALAEDPMNPIVQLNLGLAFEMNEEYDKAVQAYSSAAELGKGDPEFQFVTSFNIGSALAKKKDVDGALAAYQQALSFKPDSLETKTNIELLVATGGGGGGQGEGAGGQSEEKKDSQGGGDQKQPPPQGQQPQNEKQKQQPKPFDSKELTPQDVKKILDEIKNQEQSIRAQDYKKGQKDSARGGKDW